MDSSNIDIMEEGELPSSPENVDESSQPPPPPPHNSEIQFEDDIFDDANYVIIHRPKSSLPAPSNSAATSDAADAERENHQKPNSKFSPTDFNYQAQQQSDVNFTSAEDINGMDYSQFGKEAYYKKIGISDLLESSDKDSNSGSDSDDDYYGGKRSRMAMPSGHQFQNIFNGASSSAFCSGSLTASSSMPNIPCMNDSSSPQQHGALNDFFAASAKFQKERKPNMVWSNVMQEEEISKGLGHQVRVGGGFSEVEVTRGSETYYFQRPARTPRPRRKSDSSDISSEGLSDNALHYLKDGNEPIDDDEVAKATEDTLPTSFKSRSTHQSSGSSRKQKRRRNGQKHKRQITNKLKKMKAPELARYMANKLKEEKVQLLTRAVETIGKDLCIHIFLKTLKIEKRGGIMIKSQERRRTPGGVFLYLIRGDRRIPKSTVDAIFRDERTFYDRNRKKMTASKRLQKKAELESSKAVLKHGSRMKMGDTDDLSESLSDYTALPEEVEREGQDHDETDTGQLGDDSTQESSVHSRDTTAEEDGFMGMHCDGSES